MQTVHFHSPRGWMNDPNGFIWYKGIYHVFFQHFPFAPQWGTICWGHLTSPDLVQWQEHDIALFPTVPADQNGCFSGSAIADDKGRMWLFYTGVHYDEVNPANTTMCMPGQLTSSQLAINSPDGFSFDNFHGKQIIIPPITDPAIGDSTHTRDPKVWRGDDGWYLSLGSNLAHSQGEILFYRSRDLSTWEYVNRKCMSSKLGWMCECPDVFCVGSDAVLLASFMSETGDLDDQSFASVVEFCEKTCTLEMPHPFVPIDYGHDIYAPQTTNDERGRRVMLAWMRMPAPVDGRWIGMFCAPRLVNVIDGKIFFNLHPNVRSAIERGEGKGAWILKAILRDSGEINLGGLRIWQDRHAIHVDRTKVYKPKPGFMYTTSETPVAYEVNKLEILVDDHVVEIYINDGQYVLSNIVYGLSHELQISGTDVVSIVGI